MVGNSRFCGLLAFLLAARSAIAASQGWHLVQNGTSGLVALESMIISDTLALFFDRATNDPLQIDNHTTWGAFWHLEKNIATPIRLISNSFCAAGGYLSNGTMVSVGGMAAEYTGSVDGRMGLRILEPCEDPDAVGCVLFDDPEQMHLVETRWYPSALRLFDGSMMVSGGMHEGTFFYNTDPVNSYEFFPSKDGGVPRPSDILSRTGPINLFPRTIGLPDGKVWIAAGNQTIIYDVEKNTETRLPDIPNGVYVTNPFDGTAVLLPLHPPHYTPEILVCGGTTTLPGTPAEKLSVHDPASTQCSRMTLTPEGIQQGWQVEHMLESRVMLEIVLLPTGQGVIINGAQTGYASYNFVSDQVGLSNADNPAFTPSVYTPDAPLGQRISNEGMPTSNIARLYHSSVTLTPKGNLMIGGSNPNGDIDNTTTFPSEFRIEYLNPPYMTVDRPAITNFPKQIGYNANFDMNVNIPENLDNKKIQVALMDLGFSTHGFHQSQLLVFMDAQLSANGTTLTVTTPPNNRVYPPGPAYIFLTVDGVASTGARVMVGSGAPPPVPDQGVPLSIGFD